MTDVKEKALVIMLKEMEKEHTKAEDKIHNWLCDQDDEELFKGVLKQGKSISNALNYCGHKAREMAMKGVAIVDDLEVFDWVKEYYLSDETNVKQETSQVATSIKSKNKPVKDKKKSKEKPKANKPKINEGLQLDLLDFL